MKRIQLVVGIGLISIAVANSPQVQKPIIYRDNAKNPRIVIQGNQGFFAPGESFELSGNVQIKRLSQSGSGVVETLMTCAKASGDMLKIREKMEVDKVRMTGGIKFSQTSKESSINASGDNAEYDLKGNLREVNVNGDVNINFGGTSPKETVNKAGQKVKSTVTSTMNTTSKSATLTFKTILDEKKNEIAELQIATIRGPIQFNGTQLVKEGGTEKLQKVFAKADKMTYNIAGESGREVRLEGNLEFREVEGTGDGAMVEGATLLILQLNDKNEITKLKFRSGAGQQVTTTVTKDSPKKSGGK